MTAPTYSSAKYAYTATPVKPSTKGHTRRATEYTYSSPQPPLYQSPPAYTSAFYTTAHHAPPKQTDFVSATERMRRKARGSAGHDGSKQYYTSSAKQTSKNTQPKATYVYYEDDEGYYSPSKDSPPPPYYEHQHYHDGYRVADHHTYDQVPAHKPSSAEKTKAQKTTVRPRAASYSTPQKSTSQRVRSSSNAKPPPPKSPPKATAADAARLGIPAGYSYKNWDPSEEPILLLGSVFDANSLGRWIYDWTVFHHGAATPMSDLAGELWLLLIQLAGKIKRAEECSSRIRRQRDVDLIEDFLESGERLWKRFSQILKICEDYMWRVAKRESRKKGNSTPSVGMGPKSGCEFVDSIFGRDRKLEDTEKLMTGMRLWSMRFDANCEEILRHPSR